ncbi:MAG: hypothetical protein ABSD20_03420 [Terriglobales bacterium]
MKCFRSNYLVLNPQYVVLTLLYGLELERNGRVPFWINAITEETMWQMT